MMFDVVVTGIGIICSVGVGRQAFWENVKRAKTGIGKVTQFDTSSFRCDVAGFVDDFDPSIFMAPQVFRRMSRVSRMAVAASVEAIQDSGLPMKDVDKSRFAVVMGTAYGSSSCVEDFYVSFLQEGPRGAHPFLFPETVPNAPASHIAMFHGLTGPNTTFSQNQISSENAMVYARNLLMRGQADVVLVAGADELSAMQFSCFNALRVLNSTKVENGGPSPVPKLGGGLVLGEGAGVLVMERSDYARQRGARVYGTLRSGVLTGGVAPIGQYETNGEQAIRASKKAIEEAGIDIAEIDHISVSANFSKELGRLEHRLLQQVFGGDVNNLAISPLKYMTGDFGGAGAVRAAAILLGLYHEVPLPSLKGQTLIGGADEPFVWKTNGRDGFETALMTSTTFGGGSSSLIWTKH